MIPQAIITQILDRTDIVELIQSCGVSLKRAGREYVACCPFHGEKTASFHVSPVRQTWHCFGACNEGGNAIGFLMKREGLTFPEAVRRLGAQVGVNVSDEVEDPLKKQERLKREALLILNDKVADFYADLLNSPAGKEAKAYAVTRWGKDYVMDAGLGYAPAAWDSLVQWSREKGENQEFLAELGLLKERKDGTYYDFFRDRLVIPVRDRLGHVTGFSCRTLSDEKDVAKYMNSPESAAYDKSTTVFGIDVAWRAAFKEQIMYLVEGAADAMKMHSVGIYNVVASCGSAWTDGQLSILKKATPNLCFIPDADAVKPGERYGTGIKAVLKNGKEAVRHGFNVTVREIPNGEGNQKQDPGDFFTGKDKLKLIPEEDFILWTAQKLVNKEDPIAKQREAFQEVAELASLLRDELTLKMLLPELRKLVKAPKGMWESAIEGHKNLRNREKRMRDEADTYNFGFVVEKGGYAAQTEKGLEHWSNFTMKPLFHVRDEDTPRRLFVLKNQAGHECQVEMTMEELVSLSKFRQKIEGAGNYVWRAKEPELIRLREYLYANTDTARRVKMMGWQQQGFFAFGNGIWADGEFRSADKYGIVRLDDQLGNWYIPAAAHKEDEDAGAYERERNFIYINIQKLETAEYLTRFCEVFGSNGKIGLLYFLASCFRDIITGYTRSFPLLDLFGQKGSGKTELGAALMAFFTPDNKAPNLRNSTPTALNNAVAFAANALVHLDEYKNDLHPKTIEFLKGMYDGVGRLKMGGEGFQKQTMTQVKSGIIISGQEMPTADIALFHRCVFLQFPRSEFSVEERRRFAELQEVQRKGLTPITLEVMRYRKRVEAGFPAAWQKAQDDVTRRTDGARLETRIVENWTKLLAMQRILEDHLLLPFSYEEMLTLCVRGIQEQNRLSSTGNELATFWKAVASLVSDNSIFYRADFIIRTTMSYRTKDFSKQWKDPRRILILNPSRVFHLVQRYFISVGEKPLPETTLVEYLKQSADYLEKSKVERMWKVNREGYPELDGPNLPGEKPRYKSYSVRCWAFDYDGLSQRYEFNLYGDETPEQMEQPK